MLSQMSPVFYKTFPKSGNKIVLAGNILFHGIAYTVDSKLLGIHFFKTSSNVINMITNEDKSLFVCFQLILYSIEIINFNEKMFVTALYDLIKLL